MPPPQPPLLYPLQMTAAKAVLTIGGPQLGTEWKQIHRQRCQHSYITTHMRSCGLSIVGSTSTVVIWQPMKPLQCGTTFHWYHLATAGQRWRQRM